MKKGRMHHREAFLVLPRNGTGAFPTHLIRSWWTHPCQTVVLADINVTLHPGSTVPNPMTIYSSSE